jgi:hypothetical protein
LEKLVDDLREKVYEFIGTDFDAPIGTRSHSILPPPLEPAHKLPAQVIKNRSRR